MQLRRGASERELLAAGRLSTLALTVLGVLWVPLIPHLSGELYVYTHKMMGYFAPPITAVFVVGCVWPRANFKGAITCMAVGFCVGVTRLVLEATYVGSSPPLLAFAKSNFLVFTAVFGWCCIALLVVVSLLTPPPPPANVAGLTLMTAVPAASAHVATEVEMVGLSETRHDDDDALPHDGGVEKLASIRARYALLTRMNVGLSAALVVAMVSLYVVFR